MRGRSPETPEARIRRVRPFARWLEVERVEPVGGRFAHSGTAFFVTATDGRRFKLRDCGRRTRAAAIERHVRALPQLFPRLIAREGRYLLLEELENHRRLERGELLERAQELGRMSALAHRAARSRSPHEWLRRRFVALASFIRFFRDLAFLRRRATLPAASCRGAARKYRAHFARFGLPIDVELDDLHKGNVMIRDSDGDLRYVDEEAIGLRPRGTGMATLLKTVTESKTWELYRQGYGEIGDPSFITLAYTEYLLLMDAVRRVAHKVRTEGRLEKLPREIAELREMADVEGLSLGWRFPRG